MSWIHCWLNFLGESVNNWPGKHISMEKLQVWIGHTTHLSELISDFHKTGLWLNEPSLVLYIFPNQLLDLISSPNAVVLPDNFSLWTGWQMSSGRSLHGLWCLQMTPWSIVSLKITTSEGQLRLRQGQRRCEMKRGWPERGGHADDPLRQSPMGAAERRKLLHPSNSSGEGGTNGWTNYFNNNPPNICWAPSPKPYNVLLLKRSRHCLDKSLLFILWGLLMWKFQKSVQ